MSSTGPLETFLQDYIESADGLWEEAEPQVYDVLLPESAAAGERMPLSEDGMVRITFDPEALPEHPGSQFMTLGTPLMDGVLEDAQGRGRWSRGYLVGLHLSPQNLPSWIRQSVDLPEGAALELVRMRGQSFSNAVFWFSATFVSDQKEQEKFPVAMDLHTGRQVRHLEELLSPAHLSEVPGETLPEAPRRPLTEAYRLARERAVRSVGAVANQRRRDLEERRRRQEARMTQYYRDLREEVREQIARAESRSTDPSRAVSRLQAVEQEEKLRLAELRRKSALRVNLRLLNVLEVRQPKLLLECRLSSRRDDSAALSLVWDPLVESLEAPACPECAQPTFRFRFRFKCPTWLCPSCAAHPPERKGKKGQTPAALRGR